MESLLLKKSCGKEFKMRDSYKELFSNMFVFALSNIGTKLVLFFLVPLYTKYMSSREYGTADLITTTTSLFIPIVTLSINESVYRFTMDNSVDDKDVLKCFYYIYLFSTAITVIISAGLVFIPSMEEYVLFFVLLMITTILNDGYALFIKGSGKNKVFALDSIVYVISLVICNMLFLINFNMGISGYLLAIIISKVISMIYLLIFGNALKFVLPKRINWVLLKQMFQFSIPLLFNSINWWIISSSDKYMLNYMLGSSEVGLYSISAKIPALVNIAITVFTEAWTIASIKEYNEGKGTAFYNSVFELFSACMAIWVSIIMLFSRPFMHVYVSEEYYDASTFLPTLLMSAYYLGYSSFIGVTFSTVMKSEVIMKSSLYAAGINIIFNLALIPRIGGLGAAVATMVTYMAISLYRYVKAQNYMPLNFSKPRFIITIVVLTVQEIAVTTGVRWIFISIICLFLIIIIYYKTVIHIISVIVSVLNKWA